MAGSRELRCVGPSYQLTDRKASSQRTVNMYLSKIEGEGEDRAYILVGCPGFADFTSESYRIDALIANNGRLYYCTNGSLKYFDYGVGGGTIGSVAGDGPWSMSIGTGQMFISAGSSGYVYNLTSGVLSQVTDPDWLGADYVVNIDGYFVFNRPDTDQFYISAIDDGTSFDALDFSSADVQPDSIITLRAHKRELYLFGEYSTEVWVNSGDSTFPFTRYNATPIDVGVVGRLAAINTTDSLFFVGNTRGGRGFVYQMQGYTPVRISTKAVEQALNGSTDLSACAMWTYQTDGAEFVGLWAPGMSTTWVFDMATNQWHERAEIVDGEYAPLDISGLVFDGARHVVAYSPTGLGLHILATLDSETHRYQAYASGEGQLVRERTWPHLISSSTEPVNYRSLELMCTTGEGGGSVTLEVSNDGGATFGPPLLRSLGAVGRRMERVRWNFLGTARDRVFRLRCSDDVAFNIYGATVDAT